MKKLLLIDDDMDEAELFSEALETIGKDYEFTSFNNGQEALQYISRSNTLPDFIFLDLNMPMLSGKEILRRLRDTTSGSGIPVIIYSTSITDIDRKETSEYEVTDYLQKPETFEVLCIKLKNIIK
ncbi:response regulator [Pollutibacter soli]|uniref:response regulator n=1 Tax=Pollutibacter soli TaxID=3034157 RepID=UPI00301368B9